MSPTNLDCEELKLAIIEQLKKTLIGALATAEGDFVTARQMMFISDGLTIYFMTTNFTRKYKQILVNPNVAIALGNIQIEGVASIKGRTSDKKNVRFLEALERLSPETYKKYRDYCQDPETTMHLIKVTPKRIALFTGLPDSHLDVLNVDKKTAIRYYGLENYAPNY
jgi:general stress protein 26